MTLTHSLIVYHVLSATAIIEVELNTHRIVGRSLRTHRPQSDYAFALLELHIVRLIAKPV